MATAAGGGWKSQEKNARERIATDQYDVEAWNIIGIEAQSRPISEAALLYEELLTTFPTAARFWRSYAEAQMAVNNDDAVKHIFSRCLLNCLNVDLWRCYIRFIRKVNESKGAEGRDETKKAFDFMLSHIGMDVGSGPVWLEYISFLKSSPVSSPQDESQRMTSVRKAYQRAVLVPTHSVEQLWKEYESFENSISRALAKGLLAEYQPRHYSARAVYRERKKFFERIDTNMLAVPPTGTLKEQQQCAAWKQLLAFEKGNPQRLDSASLSKRVAFTYEQCLMYLYHYPDLWYDYATWHAQNGSQDSATAVFQRAVKALPDSTILHYAFAEFEESHGNIQEAKKVYEALLRNSKTATALSYIQFMRFIHRAEGAEAARKILLEARKSPSCTYHVYVASAMMVYCLDKDPKVARNIFEIGLKKYIHEPAYVLEYADFLCRLNDDQNVRVLFERALSVLPPDESVEVWTRFMSFEQAYGDLSSMLKVEQRRKEALAQAGDDALLEGSLQQLVSRYRFLDLWPCSPQDLDHFAHQQLLAQRLSGKGEKLGNPSFPTLAGSTAVGEKTMSAPVDNTVMAGSGANVARPDVSKMVVYDPRQGLGGSVSSTGILPGIITSSISAQNTLPLAHPLRALHHGGTISLPQLFQSSLSSGPPLPGLSLPGWPPRSSGSISSRHPQADVTTAKAVEEAVKILPPIVATFLIQLPLVDGPVPDVEMVISVLQQAKLPNLYDSYAQQFQPAELGMNGNVTDIVAGRIQSAANGSVRNTERGSLGATGSSKQPSTSKRKEPDRQEEDDAATAQSRPTARDVFRLRQLQRARVGNSGQAGSASGGSGAMTGEPSGSSG